MRSGKAGRQVSNLTCLSDTLHLDQYLRRVCTIYPTKFFMTLHSYLPIFDSFAPGLFHSLASSELSSSHSPRSSESTITWPGKTRKFEYFYKIQILKQTCFQLGYYQLNSTTTTQPSTLKDILYAFILHFPIQSDHFKCLKYIIRWPPIKFLIKYSISVIYFRFYIFSTSFLTSSAKTSNLAFAIQSLHLWIFASQWFECIWHMSFSNEAMLTLNLSLNSFHLATSSLFILLLT